ncbi:hypothetical protein GGI07_003453 [Coemansia sp. Benny D115]|nr:hypothetical protein GGI07_003453 [Coemansia sp. Benny D115]
MRKFPKAEDLDSDERVHFVEEASVYTFTDPSDNVEYEFDSGQQAWFPRWNERLMEQQQSAYGSESDGTKQCPSADKPESGKRKVDDRRRKRENTNIYVSGLPHDTSEKEVAEFFAQCGALMPDILTNKPRVKLYRRADGELKGDALVTYFKAPSVQLAVDILDDSPFRAGDTARISVQKLGWEQEEGRRTDRFKRTVILERMFTLKEMEDDVTLLLDLTEDVRSECEKIGTVTSVKIFDVARKRRVHGLALIAQPGGIAKVNNKAKGEQKGQARAQKGLRCKAQASLHVAGAMDCASVVEIASVAAQRARRLPVRAASYKARPA